MNIVFVGDEPNYKLNVHEDIPFVGARCFPILVEWIRIIKPSYYICLNSHTVFELKKASALSHNGFKIVALGKKASKRLADFGVDHFNLPHPSPRNRVINDMKLIHKMLEEIKNG